MKVAWKCVIVISLSVAMVFTMMPLAADFSFAENEGDGEVKASEQVQADAQEETDSSSSEDAGDKASKEADSNAPDEDSSGSDETAADEADGTVPDAKADSTSEEAAQDEVAAEDADSDEAAEDVETEEAVEPEKQTDGNVLTAKGKKYKITVTYGEDAQIPEGASLHVKEIKENSKAYDKYLNETIEELKQAYKEDITMARFFDIEIHDADDSEIEPKADVSVKIDLDNDKEIKENEPAVVHFEKDGPVKMDSDVNKQSDICFDTESFSTYGIITAQLPASADDLDGWTFTLDRNGRYVTSQVLYNVGAPFRLGKSTNASDAAVWTFEKSGTGYGYTFYNISTVVNGEKRYLYMDRVWNNYDAAHTTLETDRQDFAVEKNDDGTYTIFIVFPQYDWTRYNLNEWGQAGGNGFAGYRYQNNDDHLNITFQTKQPVLNDRATGEYAVIVKDTDNNKYYSVQQDGSLVEVEYDEDTGRARVKLEKPVLWTYTSAHDGLSDGAGGSINYNQNDDHPDWEPYNLRMASGARSINPGTQLTETDYYRYISPVNGDGITEESANNPSHVNAKWDNAIRYENNTIHKIVWNGSSFDNTGQYIGADFENLKITGNQTAANAATVFLAVIEEVPEPKSDGETVTHIDIGINATGHLKVPLAYGTYYDSNGEVILTVPKSQNITLDLEEEIPITREDVMNATIKAYKKVGNDFEELDNAYYIDGYSANDATAHSDNQVRMEGSFKVTTLDPYDGWYDRANDDQERRSQRLDNKVYYEVSTTKKVDFPLIYNGEQLYDMNHQPLVISAEVPISDKFTYWDERDDGNQCPVVQDDFERNYSFMFPGENIDQIAGRNNRNWKSGAIIDNDYSRPYGMDPFVGDSGMDFILNVDVTVDERVTVVELVKMLVDKDGNTIVPSEDIKNSFDLYYNEDASKDAVAGVGNDFAVPPNQLSEDDPEQLAELQAKQEGYQKLDDPIRVTVPANETTGAGHYYDFNVDPGMFYVKEDKDSIPQTITDKNGKMWIYMGTRVETEYVWRGKDEDSGKRHVVEGYSGVPDVLGPYEFDGWEEANDGEEPFNGFLEFDVYNIYAPTSVNLEITKNLDGYFDGGENSNITVAFEVSGKNTKTGETYTNHAGLTFTKDDDLTKTATVKDVPFDPKNPGDWVITVTEVYSSAYELAEPERAEYYEDDGIWVVEIDNTFGGGPPGSGVVNVYKDGKYVDPAQQPAEEPEN